LELVAGLLDREPASFHPAADIGLVSGDHFHLNEDPQGFLGCPPLRFGGQQHFGGVTADGSQFETVQPGLQISR
jgi:hypothetical protein